MEQGGQKVLDRVGWLREHMLDEGRAFLMRQEIDVRCQVEHADGRTTECVLEAERGRRSVKFFLSV